MIEALSNADVWLFYAVNHGWSSPVLDVFMSVITTTAYWRPIYAFGIIALLIAGYRKGWRTEGSEFVWCALVLMASVALFDPLSNVLLKETLQRPRPYLVLGDVYQLVASGGGSFPSNHALNNAAAATIISHFFPRWKFMAWGIACTIAISRVYVGVHYPSDVLGGVVIGYVGALCLLALWRRVQPKLRFAQPPQL